MERVVNWKFLAVSAASLYPLRMGADQYVNITYVNADTTNSFTISIITSDGVSTDIPVSAGANALTKKAYGSVIQFSGAATPVSVVVSWPAETSAEALAEQTIAAVTVSGTVNNQQVGITSASGGTLLSSVSAQFAGTAIIEVTVGPSAGFQWTLWGAIIIVQLENAVGAAGTITIDQFYLQAFTNKDQNQVGASIFPGVLLVSSPSTPFTTPSLASGEKFVAVNGATVSGGPITAGTAATNAIVGTGYLLSTPLVLDPLDSLQAVVHVASFTVSGFLAYLTVLPLGIQTPL